MHTGIQEGLFAQHLLLQAHDGWEGYKRLNRLKSLT